MDVTKILRLLRYMRTSQVTVRRDAATKRDMIALRHAQADIEAIDHAIDDEIRLQQEWVADEARRLARLSPEKHTGEYDGSMDGVGDDKL